MSKQQKGTFSEKLGGRQIISYFAADDWQKTKWGNYKEYKYTKQKIFENTKLGIIQQLLIRKLQIIQIWKFIEIQN